jgi:hypothetical protein
LRRSRFADLLDDDERIVALDDALDRRDLVPRPDGEVGRDAAQLLVLVLAQRDPLLALAVTTLAENGQLVLEFEGLGELFDSLVDLAEQRLVPGNLEGLVINLVYRLRHRTAFSRYLSHRSEGSSPTAVDRPRTRSVKQCRRGTLHAVTRTKNITGKPDFELAWRGTNVRRVASPLLPPLGRTPLRERG